MPNLAAQANHTVQFVIAVGAGLGLALFLLNTFQTAVGSGTTAGSAVGNIITGTSVAITNVVVPMIAVVFILALYSLAKSYGILGGSSKE